MINQIPNSNSQKQVVNGINGTTAWSRAEDKIFEAALLEFPESAADRWRRIADYLPEKSVDDVIEHYETLVFDINLIESGRVELPNYSDEGEKQVAAGQIKIHQRERKKPNAWTVEEHQLFLLGLEIYGRGDWRSISRNILPSRTTTQIASHAQKYFERQKKDKERKRPSIHDISSNCLTSQVESNIHDITHNVESLAIPPVSNIISYVTEASTVPQRPNLYNTPEAVNCFTNEQPHNFHNTRLNYFYNCTSPGECSSTIPQRPNLYNTPEVVNCFTTPQSSLFCNITSPLDFRSVPQRSNVHHTHPQQYNFHNNTTPADSLTDPQRSNFHGATIPTDCSGAPTWVQR